MADDIRIAATLPGHPKTKKLIRRIGEAGAWKLVCLWLWVGKNRPDGDLAGMSIEDIELAVDWSGENDAFVQALVAVGFLSGEEGAYRINDWAEHNPWVNGSDFRSLKARWNAVKRHHGPAEADRQVPEWAALRDAGSTENDASSKNSGAGSNTPSKGVAMRVAGSSNAPSPSPSPSPSPEAKASPPDGGVVPGEPETPPPADLLGDAPPKPEKTPACPHADIVALYHELLPELPAMRSWPEDRQALLRTRWREDTRRQTLDWWRRFFGYVRKCPFLMGQSNSAGRDPFLADLEWLIRPKNFRKVVEGKYEAKAA